MNKNIMTLLLAGAMLSSLSAAETENRIPARGLALDKPGSDFRIVDFTRDALGPKDILIEIDYSGICHSDIHSALNEHAAPGSKPLFPIIPGHEMAGHVVRAGSEVKKFAVGDLAGVGCWNSSAGSGTRSRTCSRTAGTSGAAIPTGSSCRNATRSKFRREPNFRVWLLCSAPGSRSGRRFIFPK